MNAPRPQLQKRLDEGASSRMMIKIKFSSFVKLHRRQPEIRIRFGCGGQKSKVLLRDRVVVQVNRMPKYTARGFRSAAR
jgi:hypothetical protein